MQKKLSFLAWLAGLWLGGAIVPATLPVLAQTSVIVPDSSLGDESSQVFTLDDRGLPIDAIGGGAIRGSNLFHSFEQFNVGAGRLTTFYSPDQSIQNILTRVTGSAPSEILGTLSTFGESQPNFFLINPHGILFGPGARLDLGGSFVASTANAIGFGAESFSATIPTAPAATLTINPSALLFNQLVAQPTNSITIQGQLVVPQGQSVLLVGGNVAPSEAAPGNILVESGGLTAPGGRVEIAGVGAAGTVNLNTETGNFSLELPANLSRTDINLTQGAVIRVDADNGGSITLTGRDLNILQGSGLMGGIAEGLGTPDSQAGDIRLSATGKTTLAGNLLIAETIVLKSSIFNSVSFGATGNSGNIEITTGSLLIDGAIVATNSYGEGNAGNLSLQADRDVTLNDSLLFTSVGDDAKGNGGNIRIKAGAFSLTNQSTLSTSTSGQGNAGSVSINANDSLIIDRSIVINSVLPRAIGQGGNVSLRGRSIQISNDGRVVTGTAGQGDAGNVFLTATDMILLAGGSIFSQNTGDALQVLGGNGTARGKGGDIELSAGSVKLTQDASLDSSTSGLGDAGKITIKAREAVELSENSGILSSVIGALEGSAVGVGQGGSIEIESRSLSLDQALVSSGTLGQGNAGDIRLLQPAAITLTNNSLITSLVGAGAIGAGGDITVQTGTLTATGGSRLVASVAGAQNGLPGGQGRGGDIRVTATESVNLAGVNPQGRSGGILSNTGAGASGAAGSITVNTDRFRIAEAAVLSASTANASEAGSIQVEANQFEAINGGQLLTTTSDRGQAGSITVKVRDSLLLSGTDPTFAARLAQFGSENVNNPNPASGLFASTIVGSTGAGGSIFIDPQTVIIRDGAGVSVDSQGSGNGGNLQLQAGNLTLERGGFLSAATASGEGGNINLQVNNLLLLRQNSLISATAGGTGNGGNLDIQAGFLVSVPAENSDVIANAFEGRGGNIQISTQGIFGLEYRNRLTSSSDITASSEFGVNGTVIINTPGVDPSKGLVNLPADVVDASNLIAQGCSANSDSALGRFTIIGRGGLPPNPSDRLSSDAIWEDTRTPLPAQGWMINQNNQVVLTDRPVETNCLK